MATHEVTTKTMLHADVEGYALKHPGLYSVADSDSAGEDVRLTCTARSSGCRRCWAVCFPSSKDQTDTSLLGASDLPLS